MGQNLWHFLIFLIFAEVCGTNKKKGSYLYAKKIRHKNVLICILIYRHSKRSCYTNRVMMTTWPGHLIKRLFTIKKIQSKNIYLSEKFNRIGRCWDWGVLHGVNSSPRYLYWLPIPISYQKNSSPTCTSQQILSKFTPAIIYKLL